MSPHTSSYAAPRIICPPSRCERPPSHGRRGRRSGRRRREAPVQGQGQGQGQQHEARSVQLKVRWQCFDSERDMHLGPFLAHALCVVPPCGLYSAVLPPCGLSSAVLPPCGLSTAVLPPCGLSSAVDLLNHSHPLSPSSPVSIRGRGSKAIGPVLGLTQPHLGDGGSVDVSIQASAEGWRCKAGRFGRP